MFFVGLAEANGMAAIDFDVSIVKDSLDETRAGPQQFARGTICYSNLRIGHLIYLRSNLGGDNNFEAHCLKISIECLLKEMTILCMTNISLRRFINF